LTVTHCDEIWQRFSVYYLAVERDLTADALEKDDRLHSLAFDAKNYSRLVRGQAYHHQLEQMATELFSRVLKKAQIRQKRVCKLLILRSPNRLRLSFSAPC
jgi:hypothetical protein